MIKLITHILSSIKTANKELITEADKNPTKWYEFFVNHGVEAGTETVFSAKTFDEITPEEVMKYFEEYRFDNLYIDIWENCVLPETLKGLFTTSDIYPLIVEYFKKTVDYEQLTMVGELTFDSFGDPKFAGDFVDLNYYFKSEIAFRYFKNLTSYISENEIEDLMEEEAYENVGSTYTDFLTLVNNNEKWAQHVFDNVDWQHPSTFVEDSDELNNEDKPDGEKHRVKL